MNAGFFVFCSPKNFKFVIQGLFLTIGKRSEYWQYAQLLVLKHKERWHYFMLENWNDF